MPTFADLLFVAFFAVVAPVIDYTFFWPGFQGRSAANPASARRRLWLESIVQPWVTVGVGAAIWTWYGRSWASFGFTTADGWRLWTAIAVLLLLSAYYVAGVTAITRSAETRANVRQQAETIADLMPHTQREMIGWTAVSLTAGFCEEFLFRGYLIWFLAHWLGWWGAALLSLLVFAGWHAYQGWNGVFKTGVTGAIFTMAVAAFGSLWPAIALHALVDVANGMAAWLALREEASN
jgi:membrane protease YdiL (CAAX protease family)